MNQDLTKKLQIGLTSEEVRSLTEQGLVNGDLNVKTKTYKQIIKDNLLSLFNLVNTILAVCIAVVGSWKNGLFFLVVIWNFLTGCVQEIRAKRTIDKLSLLSAPKAHVLRDGEIQDIQVKDILLGDITQLKQGNQICADAVILDGECQVNESLITGESTPIDKKTGDPIMIDDKHVEAEKSFTAESANGVETMEFTFDATAIIGAPIVVYEQLYYNDALIAVHADIEDEDQFKEELTKYSLERLKSFYNSYSAVCETLSKNEAAETTDYFGLNLREDMYLPYYRKIGYIQAEMDNRANEVTNQEKLRDSVDEQRKEIEDELADLYLEQTFTDGDEILIDVIGGEFSFSRLKEAQPEDLVPIQGGQNRV